MNIAKRLGLSDEVFCRIVTTTKMLLSNTLGHAAELHYEKYLVKNRVTYEKAPTDEHFDFIVGDGRSRHQVKRFQTGGTNDIKICIELTKTHGNRRGADAFYERTAFDKLVMYDADFEHFKIIPVGNIPNNSRYQDRLPGTFEINREGWELKELSLELLKVLKSEGDNFQKEVEMIRIKNRWDYIKLLEIFCNLNILEVDELFTDDNFRLVTGAKGFAAEEHFDVLLEQRKIPFEHITDIYSKADHIVHGKKVQVKTPNLRSTNERFWGVKTHKSHGSGEGELYHNDDFDILALFVGFEMDKEFSKYVPIGTNSSFILIPVSELEEHPDCPGYLKRISRIDKSRYEVNDLSLLLS